MDNRTLTDAAGNTLEVYGGEVSLHLRDRSVMIGKVYADSETKRNILVTLRNSDKHLFRKMDAYGFNYQLLTELGIDLIKVVEDRKAVYLIPVSAINSIGRIDKLNFTRQGYELQRFVSRADLQQFRIE